jgi:hypothetical protein
LSRPIMVRSHCESHHSNGITDQKCLQQTSATKSAKSGLMHATRLGANRVLVDIFLLDVMNSHEGLNSLNNPLGVSD